MKAITSGVLVSLLAVTPMAAMAKDFSFTYLQGTVYDFEDDDFDGDGYNIEGSYQLANGFLVGGYYREDDFDRVDFEVEYLGINAGFAQQLNRTTAGWFRLGYADLETDSNRRELDGLNGDLFSLTGGVRTWLAPDSVEGFLVGGIERYDVDDVDDDTGAMLGGGVRLHLSENFLLGAQIDRRFALNDRDTITIEARLQM